MKSLVIIKPNNIEMIEREKPIITNQNDVLIKVKAVGICGSDIHIYHGSSPVATYPRVPGHEMAGEVIDIGKNVRDIKIGDKVVIEPMIGCGKCYACKSGRPNACSKLVVRGCHIDGGFQEYFIAPEKAVYKINPKISWEEATMVEPYTIADQITWRANIKKGDFVFIIGAGPIGLCILELAKLKGGICIISDFNKKRLSIAKELGADYIIDLNIENSSYRVNEITKGMGSNITIDAVCLPKTFEEAIDITSVAGTVMCLGFTKEISKISQLSITLKELDIKGSRHQTFKFRHIIELFNENKLNPKKLISHIIPFSQYKEALYLIENDSKNICKIVLKF